MVTSVNGLMSCFSLVNVLLPQGAPQLLLEPGTPEVRKRKNVSSYTFTHLDFSSNETGILVCRTWGNLWFGSLFLNPSDGLVSSTSSASCQVWV